MGDVIVGTIFAVILYWASKNTLGTIKSGQCSSCGLNKTCSKSQKAKCSSESLNINSKVKSA